MGVSSPQPSPATRRGVEHLFDDPRPHPPAAPGVGGWGWGRRVEQPQDVPAKPGIHSRFKSKTNVVIVLVPEPWLVT